MIKKELRSASAVSTFFLSESDGFKLLKSSSNTSILLSIQYCSFSYAPIITLSYGILCLSNVSILICSALHPGIDVILALIKYISLLNLGLIFGYSFWRYNCN